MRDRGFSFFLHDKYVANHYAAGFGRDDAGTAVFPVVTAFELLEHLPNPAADLDGLFAAGPDVVIATTKVYQGQGADWFYLSRDNGQHVFFYSLRGLDLIAQRYGMRLHTHGDLHIFYREHPRYLKYNEEALHSLRTAVSSPPTLANLALGEFQNHLKAPYAHVERDYATVVRRVRASRPPAPATPPAPRLHFKVARNRPKPRILVDSVFFQIQRTGIARVWTNLLREWSSSDFARHLTVLDRSGWAPRVPGIEYRMIEPHNYADMEAQRRLIEHYAQQEEASLFISSYYTSPQRLRSVMMVYDMIPEALGFNASDPMWVEKRAAVDHASHYICISESTRSELERLHPHTAGRTSLAYPGVGPEFRSLTEAERAAVRMQAGAPQGYYLLAGALGGHKNGRILAHALAGMDPAERLPILCTSPRTSQAELDALPPGVDVRILRVEDEVLCRLYNGATALVFPSFQEGFGLPLVEAMACGCPIITSDLPVMREVAGPAALYIDPHDTASLVQALRRMAQPEVRAGLVAAGFDRAGRFTWAGMAGTVRTILEQAAQAIPA